MKFNLCLGQSSSEYSLPQQVIGTGGWHNLPLLLQSLELENKDGNTSDLSSERMKIPNVFSSPPLPENLRLMVPVWTQQCEEETNLDLFRELGPIPAYMHLENSFECKMMFIKLHIQLISYCFKPRSPTPTYLKVCCREKEPLCYLKNKSIRHLFLHGQINLYGNLPSCMSDRAVFWIMTHILSYCFSEYLTFTVAPQNAHLPKGRFKLLT